MRLVPSAIAVAALLRIALPAGGTLVACDDGPEAPVAAALERVRTAVDPCGESAELSALLEDFERCEAARYRICTRQDVVRSAFERAPLDGDAPSGTIVWNPVLRSELEPACDTDPTTPVLRDPIASLVHEIVHAVHDCTGRPAGRFELEAVRIENIYRRAAGLCQRRHYGDEPLPASMRRTCGQSASSSP